MATPYFRSCKYGAADGITAQMTERHAQAMRNPVAAVGGKSMVAPSPPGIAHAAPCEKVERLGVLLDRPPP